MSNQYKRKYKIDDLVEKIIKLENTGETKMDISDLLELVGYDIVDIYFFYVNNIRGRFRFDKEYKDRRDL